jgi:peptidoglycan L-alanyl-D-glutamate endopeptidase CwlK
VSTSLAELTPDTQEAVARLLDHAKTQGLTVRIDSTRRTCAEQAAEYAKGRTAPGSIVTQVQGCGSYHVLGRAVDLYIGSWDCAAYEELGTFWESIGGRWGGRFSFKDCVHFEWPHPLLPMAALCPPGISCEDALAMQPGVMPQSTVAMLGAAFGAALGVAVVAARR